MNAERQRRLIEHGQRPDRHARLDAGVFNRGRRNAFAQHSRAFHDKSAKGAAGVKTARVIDHNRDFAERLHIVKGACHGLVVGLPPANDLDQFHLVHRTEEMDADEFFGSSAGFGQAADRQGRCVGCKKAAWHEQGFGFLCDFGLQVPAFKHGLDDEVATGQVCRAISGRDAREQGGLVVRLHPAFANARLGQFCAPGLACVGLVLAHILEHRRNSPAGLCPGDACAHHAGAQNADLLRLVAGNVPGPRLA